MASKAATVLGEGTTKNKLRIYTGSKTFDWAAQAGNAFGTAASETTTVTVPGVALGDTVIGVSMSVTTGGLSLTGAVTAADTVTVTAQNVSNGSINVASGTLTVVVLKQSK